VGETVVFLGWRPQGLREQRPGVDPQRELAAARSKRGALDADHIAEIELYQRIVGLAEHVLAGMQLDLSGTVLEVEKGGFAVAPSCHQPAGDPVPVRRLLAV